ncbi:hypothetical protein ABIE37_000466 [Arthrobacter bambusae]|uniref:Uncharacterized protein n=1 Tax=Arthrobacter bambusae TaxID=1338426 RepID=A0ABV2P1S7_9MICC
MPATHTFDVPRLEASALRAAAGLSIGATRPRTIAAPTPRYGQEQRIVLGTNTSRAFTGILAFGSRLLPTY